MLVVAVMRSKERKGWSFLREGAREGREMWLEVRRPPKSGAGFLALDVIIARSRQSFSFTFLA